MKLEFSVSLLEQGCRDRDVGVEYAVTGTRPSKLIGESELVLARVHRHLTWNHQD